MKKRKTGMWITKKSLQLGDGRRSEMLYYNMVRGALIGEIGEPTTQQQILINDIAYLELKTHLYKQQFLSGKEMSPEVDKYFLSWVNSKRRCIEALGFKKITKNVKDIFSYCEETFGKK